MTTTKRISAILLGTVLLGAIAAGAAAQSEHEGHHPGGSTPAAPEQSAPKEAAPAPDNAMGMMGGNDMSKMMQGMHGTMMGGMAAQPSGDTGPASQAFHAAIAKMHGEMTAPFTGDADVDFTKRMIAHHRGAIDMAKAEIGFGKDPTAKTAAEHIIKMSEADIAKLQEWLKSRGK